MREPNIWWGDLKLWNSLTAGEASSQQVRHSHYFEAASQLVLVSQSHNWGGDLTALKQPNNRWDSLTNVKQPRNWWGNLGSCETVSKQVRGLVWWPGLWQILIKISGPRAYFSIPIFAMKLWAQAGRFEYHEPNDLKNFFQSYVGVLIFSCVMSVVGKSLNGFKFITISSHAL